MLPNLAQGFHVQRGSVFGFGEFSEDNPMLLTAKSLNLLDQAPINNMNSERDVGSINYELKIRGAKQLSSCSYSHVKAKLHDLIELKPQEFRNHYTSAYKISKILDV